jgi:RluA family pseudouridine synthase
VKQHVPFTIIYEDSRLVVVNKPAGIAVGADRWDESKERLDRLLEKMLRDREAGPEQPGPELPPEMAASPEPLGTAPRREGARIFVVHRIDRDTSGLVLFAKDRAVHRLLSGAFEDRRVTKRYLAVVQGRPVWRETDCDLPLVPDGNKRHLTIIDKYRGKKSRTRFRLLGSAGNYSVLEAVPETGRTHQIRVHLAALGHPVVCDSLYGSTKPVLLSSFKRNWRGDPLQEKPLLARLGLHAAALVLPDYRPPSGASSGVSPAAVNTGPGDGAAEPPEPGGLSLKAPLPRDMAALVKQMEKEAGKDFRFRPERPPARPPDA